MFRAPGNGTQTAGIFQDTVTTTHTALFPDPRFGGLAHEVSIKARQDRGVHIFFGQRLDANAAGHGEYGIVLVDIFLKRGNEFLNTLTLHGDFLDLQFLTRGSSGGTQGGSHGTGFFLASGKTDRYASAAADGEHLLFALEHPLDILQRFLFGNNHVKPLTRYS